MKKDIGSLYFPSGFTVDQCKSEARGLKAKYKEQGEFISYACALNMVAYDHSNMKWDDAIKMVQEKQGMIQYHLAKEKNPTENLSPEDEVATYKAVAEQYFLKDGKLIVPESESNSVEMFAQNGNGLLITNQVKDKLDDTMSHYGGVQKIISEYQDFKVIFSNDEEKKQTHEFYFNNEGTLLFYVKKEKSDTEPNFFATHYVVCYPGESPRPIQSCSHYLDFIEEWQNHSGKVEGTESYDI